MRFILIILFPFIISVALFAEDQVKDPLEDINRKIFYFNEKVDRFILSPTAKLYDFILPDPVELGVANIYHNIRTPIYLVSDIMQFNFHLFFSHLGRFLINSTLGLGGFVDLATHWGIRAPDNDMGLSLANFGIGHGVYLVVPFFGVMSLRDGAGRLFDSFLEPSYWIAFHNASGDNRYIWSVSIRTLDAVNTRSAYGDLYQSAREASFDFYLFVRSSYFQKRKAEFNTIKGKDLDEEIFLEDDF